MADATPQDATPDGQAQEHAAQGNAARGNAGGRDAVLRADALLTDVGQRLGQWSARLQRESSRLAARTREEFEDMWAEAQALRHQEHGASALPRQQVRIEDAPPEDMSQHTERAAEEQAT